MENPFLLITPRKNEKIIGLDDKKLKALAKQIITEKKILIISGDYGSGKSLIAEAVMNYIPKKIETKKLLYGVDLLSELKNMPLEKYVKKKLVIFIDKFDLCEAHKDEELKQTLDLMVNITKAGVSFVVYSTPNLSNRFFELSDEFKGWSTTYRVPPLSYEQSRELILDRLNEIRKKKSKEIDPFKEEEINSIIRNSKGNPRLMLLLAAAIYETKKEG